MNHRYLICIFLLAALTACRSSQAIEEGVTKTGEGFLIRPRFEKGDQYRMIAMISETTTGRDTPQGDWTMQNQMTRNFEVEVTADKSKLTTHTATLKRIQVVMDDGVGLKEDFDSESPAGSQMEPYFMPQIGGKTTIKYSPGFYAEEVEFEGKVSEEMMWSKNAEYTAQEWTLERRRLDAIFPDKAIKAGSTWQDQRTISSFYPLEMTRNFTVVGEKGGVLAISMEGTARPPSNRFPTMEMGMKIDYELDGKVTGVYKIDLGTGRLLTANTTFDLRGKSILMGSDTTISFPITINQTVSNRYIYE